MVPDSKKMDMPYVVATTAKWVRDLEYECFSLHGDKEGVLQLLLGKVARECRFEGQEWQILRQVSPTTDLGDQTCNSPSNNCPHQSSTTTTESKRAVKQLIRYLQGTTHLSSS